MILANYGTSWKWPRGDEDARQRSRDTAATPWLTPEPPSFDTATSNNFCVYHCWLGDKGNYPATAPKLSPGKSEPETQAFAR